MKILTKKAIASLKPYKTNPLPSQCIAKLDANENPYDLPLKVKDLIFKELKKARFNRYPDPEALKLRETFSQKVRFPLSWIMAGNGSDELLLYLVLTFAREKILFFSPTFAMYRVIGMASGAKIKDIPLQPNFELPFKEIFLEKKISIIFISTPNNPTGNCFRKEDIVTIIKKTGALVVVDEAYTEFCNDSFLPYLKKFKNLVILRTFSKAFGLAGIRLGFMLAHPHLIQEVNKVRLPYNLSLFSQLAGRIVLEKSSSLVLCIKSIIAERERIFKNLCNIDGLIPYPSQANFILFKTCICSDKLYSYLNKKGVILKNLNSYGGLKDCLRVTIGTRQENNIFLEKLRSYFYKR